MSVGGSWDPPQPALTPLGGPHLRKCLSRYNSVARFLAGRSRMSSRRRSTMAKVAVSLSDPSCRPRLAALASASAFKLSLANPTSSW